MPNKYVEHLHVIVEDDANRQLINGLSMNPKVMPRRLGTPRLAGGWRSVLDHLTDPDLGREMVNYSKRHLLLLIDFDDHFDDRWSLYKSYKSALTPAISERIYLLGCLHEPEKLKADFKYARSIETLGYQLSDDCEPAPAQNLWQHAHLQHNAIELSRLVTCVKPFLFNL